MSFGKFLLIASLALGLAPATRAAEGDAAFAVSPESAYSLLDTAIRDAHQSILLNIYMLTNRGVTDALAAKAANENVKVTVLLEGQTFGGDVLFPVKRILDDFAAKLAQAGGNGKFLVMTSQAGGKRRYAYDHAKYMVVDGRKVFVSSENITGSAFNSRNLSGGTRGWEIYVENAALGAQLSEIFAEDSDTSHGDVMPYDQVRFKVKDPGNSPLPPRRNRDVQSFDMQRGRVSETSLCASPRSLDCVLQFIRSAKKELAVEHLSLPKLWVGRGKGPDKPNPIVDELVAAARRGVKVRVLLNDDAAFGGDEGKGNDNEKNTTTVTYLRGMAAQSRLPLEAAIFSGDKVQVNYVHNKGMVADGARVFVSSINGTENSIQSNREVALAVTSADAARYFGAVFDFDWKQSQ